MPILTRNGTHLLSSGFGRGGFSTQANKSIFERTHQIKGGRGDGNLLMRNPAFGSSEFRQVVLPAGKMISSDSQSTSQLVGPGTYNLDRPFNHILKRQPCTVKIKELSLGKDMAKSGHLRFEGDRLVFDQSFSDSLNRKNEYYKTSSTQ